jgi:hypothetical protein
MPARMWAFQDRGQRLEVKGDKKNLVDFKPTSATVNNGVDA